MVKQFNSNELKWLIYPLNDTILNLKQREVKSGFGIAYVYGRNWVS